jgi:hypothetical protein
VKRPVSSAGSLGRLQAYVRYRTQVGFAMLKVVG